MCDAPGCTREAVMHHLACVGHWYGLPNILRLPLAKPVTTRDDLATRTQARFKARRWWKWAGTMAEWVETVEMRNGEALSVRNNP